jgi:hypothetical protein
MGLIINPRGASGSGKTELVRRILGEYGWKRGGGSEGLEPLFWPRRKVPFAYRLCHPAMGAPLVVLGHYEVTSGGCDTIRVSDGGLAEAARTADQFASSGYDVVLEGLRLSSDVNLTRRLADLHAVHILLLSTPIEQCVKNLIARRRAGKASFGRIERAVIGEHRRVREACELLRGCASLESLGFEQAFTRTRELLGLPDKVNTARGA